MWHPVSEEDIYTAVTALGPRKESSRPARAEDKLIALILESTLGNGPWLKPLLLTSARQPGAGRIPELRTLFIMEAALEQWLFFFMSVWLRFNKALGF